jgi:hypothetical protein
MPLSRRRLQAVLLCFGLALLAGNAVAQTSAADLVARGAYLARAGDCVSCDTAPGGQDMYPVMPFDSYTRVTREDSDAIYAYLHSLPAVSNSVVVNHLRSPFNQRWSMAV